jgi:2-oxoglutarate dehydrogenase E2 component (dihydrolipoamide succinyltransferase)
MSTEVKVPVLGESITEATLGQWLKKPGEAVAIDEPIASLETDKVAVEVPSPVAGIMGAYAVEEGATVNVGAVIGSIDAGTGAAAPVAAAARPAAAAAVVPAVTTTAAPAADAENSDLPLSPAVRRLVPSYTMSATAIAIADEGKAGASPSPPPPQLQLAWPLSLSAAASGGGGAAAAAALQRSAVDDPVAGLLALHRASRPDRLCPRGDRSGRSHSRRL